MTKRSDAQLENEIYYRLYYNLLFKGNIKDLRSMNIYHSKGKYIDYPLAKLPNSNNTINSQKITSPPQHLSHSRSCHTQLYTTIQKKTPT